MKLKRDAKFDLIGIGSPLMDYMIDADDALLSALDLVKGAMRLIDETESTAIRKSVASRVTSVVPGGSAANTIAGAALIGASCAFMGSIGDDEEGSRYVTQTESAGVKTFLRKHRALTGHAITFITPGGERTFATHLGAAVNLSEDDVDDKAIADSRILHVEGYLLEPPMLRTAAIRAMRTAKMSGGAVSVDVSDPGLVARMGDSLKDIIREFADILFMNEEEARAFTGKDEDDAARDAGKIVQISIVKLGARGSIIASEGALIQIPPFPAKVVNTNGAGDMYAGAFLYGCAKGMTLESAGRVASFASSRVVAADGARLDVRPDIESVI
jgi:sugar/nucleoside kinase (ribokinase family)